MAILCYNPSLIPGELLLQLMAECSKGSQSGGFVIDAPTYAVWKFDPCHQCLHDPGVSVSSSLRRIPKSSKKLRARRCNQGD